MKIRISLLILFLGIYWAEAGAQIQSDTGYIIALTHLTKEKVKFIAPGKKITIWYGEGKVKGRLTAITPDNIFIDNSAYSPYQIIKIRALLPGTTAGGAVATAGGAGVLALGGYLGKKVEIFRVLIGCGTIALLAIIIFLVYLTILAFSGGA